jgi:hypothetical protein
MAKFVDLDGNVLIELVERSANQVALVGSPTLRGKTTQLFVPTKDTIGVARVVVGARIGTCATPAGIAVARRCLAAMHNRGVVAEVRLLHGYLVTSVRL